MDIKKYINKYLTEFFDYKIKQTKLEEMKIIKEFVLRGGKRIRPFFMYWSYKGFGGEKKIEIIKTACFLELIHAYLLIHDDIFDKDKLRRSKPTIWAKHGIEKAIIIGNISCALGYEILNQANFPADLKIKALNKLNKILINVNHGQILDLELAKKNSVSEKEIFNVHKYKTSKYTVEGPLHLGAILAGANQRQISSLSNYGTPLGIAFQIKDDILGMFGNAKILGKPTGSDIKENKKTLLICKALEKADTAQKHLIKKILGNPKFAIKQLGSIRKIVKQTGSLEYSQKTAQRLVKQAKNALDKIDLKKQAKQELTNMADFIIERSF